VAIEIENAIDPTPCFEIMGLGVVMYQKSNIVVGKVNSVDLSLELSSLRKKSRTQSPSLVRHAQTFNARPPSKLNPMLKGTKTHATFSH
jgi:hypothetical protein